MMGTRKGRSASDDEPVDVGLLARNIASIERALRIPSGVSSKAQVRIRATGKPSASSS